MYFKLQVLQLKRLTYNYKKNYDTLYFTLQDWIKLELEVKIFKNWKEETCFIFKEGIIIKVIVVQDFWLARIWKISYWKPHGFLIELQCSASSSLSIKMLRLFKFMLQPAHRKTSLLRNSMKMIWRYSTKPQGIILKSL